MLDQILDLFDRDRKNRRDRGERPGGLRGLIDRVTDHDDDRSRDPDPDRAARRRDWDDDDQDDALGGRRDRRPDRRDHDLDFG